MKSLILSLSLALAFILPLHAQDDPPADTPADPPPAQPPVEYHSVPRPVRLYGHIRLDGLWEIHIGGKNTGVELSIKQINNRYHATFSKPPANNPLGIKVGDDFLWATVEEYGGTGTLFVVDKPEKEGGAVKREQAPIQFRINNTAERIRVQVDKEDMNEAMKRFELVRVGRIESFRLYASSADGLQPAASILEDVPMVVEIKHSNPRPSPIDVTITSGSNTITLTARPLEDDKENGPQLGLLRTEPFYATFGNQVGIEVPPRKEEEPPPGREATEKDWKPFAGTWRTLYQDGVLGPVTGWMHIDEYGRPTLRYRQPGADIRELKLKSARVDGETKPTEAEGDNPATPAMPKLILHFEGQGVVSEKVEKKQPDEKHRLLLDPLKPIPIIIAANDEEAKVDLTYRYNAGFREVTLTLAGALANGSLLWDWDYTGDRATGRDREGLGRAGLLTRMDGKEESTLAKVVGREIWMRQPPTIVAAYATDDQIAEEKQFWDQPVYKNRYKDKTYRSSGLEHKMGATGESTRRVFIVARNLPPATEKIPNPDLLIGTGSRVKEYRIRARGTEDDPGNSDELKAAWHQFRENQGRVANPDPGATPEEDGEAPDPTVAALMEGVVEEGIFILAIIDRGAEPGPQPFTLAEAKGDWNLMFGDLRGTLKLARELAKSTPAEGELEAEAGEWEALSPAFAPEDIRIVVEMETASPSVKEIKAVLGHNSEIISAGFVKEGETPKPFILKPDPNDPKTYLSPVIHLIRKGTEQKASLEEGDIALEVSSGDKLNVRVQTDSGYFISPTNLSIDVMATPSELNQLWKEAVKTAADLAGHPVEDWNDVVRGTADSQTNFIFTEFVLDLPNASRYISIVAGFRALVDYAESNGVKVPYSKWLPQNPEVGGFRNLKISVGDHAAMLLLRREFITMMNEQITDWQRNRSPVKVRALYENQKDIIASKRSPLSFMRIPMRTLPVYREEPRSGPINETRVHLAENKLWWVAFEGANPILAQAIKFFGGDDVGRDDDPYLYQLFDNEFLGYKTRVPADAEYFELFQWSAFNYAYEQWGPQMRQSLAQAAAIPDGDVKALLKLAGNGFEPVVKRVVPRMMKLDSDAGSRQTQWKPDPLARAHVKALGVLGGAIRAQEDYSSVDTTVMLAAAAVATAPLGGAGMWSSIIAASVSAADLAYTVYNDVYSNSKRKEELEFEVGAGAALGVGRAAELEGKILGDIAQTFAVVGSGIGLGVDGLAVYRSVKALKTAELIERGSEIMRQIDFADPKALRALSSEDQLVLREMLKRSEEIAKAGRFGDLSPEAYKALKNRDSILKGLNASDDVSAEAIELASKRRERLLAAGDEQPTTTWRDRDFVEADNNLRNKIEANERRVEQLREERKAITDKHPEMDNPPPGSSDARRVRELDREATKISNESKVFKQRRDLVNSYRKPRVEVPPRQAEILRGEGLAPSRSEFDALRDTRTRVADGRPPVSREGLESVDLDAARKGIDDLTRQAEKKVDELVKLPDEEIARRVASGELEPRALENAKARLDDLKEVSSDIEDLSKNIRSDNPVTLRESDADMLSGKRSKLLKYDEAQVIDAVVDAEGDWAKLSKLADGTAEEQTLLHKVNQWRQEKMDSALRKSMRESEDILGLERDSITASAFGSTNLTSDYDISVNAPNVAGAQRGAELTVRRFQEKVRNLLGGRESGMVLDVNVYTDPIYTIFKGSELEGSLAGITARQVDQSRQFLFQQMANVRYRSPGQWKALRGRILDGVPPQTRAAFSDILDQAEGANLIAGERVAARLDDMDQARNLNLKGARDTIEGSDAALAKLKDGEDAALRSLADKNGSTIDQIKNTDDAKKIINDFATQREAIADAVDSAEFRLKNANLRANNELYSDALEFMDGSKKMIADLDAAVRGKIPAGEVSLPPYLRDTEVAQVLGEAQKFIRSGDPKLVEQGNKILEELRNKAIVNLRNKQGEALYYAAEAYQTEATINHVVKEIQKPPAKKITTESIMSGNHLLAPPKKPLSPDDYLNSYYENGANLVKELNAKHILDELGQPVSGSSKMDKGATKASKYFKRQLDAASMAKLDMNAVKVPGFPEDFSFRKLVESTLELEDNRGSSAAFRDTLKKYNMTSEDYLRRVVQAQEELDSRLIAQSELNGYVNNLRAAENIAESEASKAVREGFRRKQDWVRGYGAQHYKPGEEAEAIRKEFDANAGARLLELDQAVGAGRFLTAGQKAEQASLSKIQESQNALDQAILGARITGIAPTEIDPILRGIPRDNEGWRDQASERILQAAGARLPNSPPDPGKPADLPEATRKELGIAPSGDKPTANDLIGAYKSNGKYAETRAGMTLDEIATNQRSGRTVLANVRKPDGGSSWVKVHEVTEGSIIADDPVSGNPISYPPSIFKSLSGETLIADPFRDANGSFQ